METKTTTTKKQNSGKGAKQNLVHIHTCATHKVPSSLQETFGVWVTDAPLSHQQRYPLTAHMAIDS